MKLLPLAFLVIAGGLSLATFTTSQTLHAGTACVKTVPHEISNPG